MVGYSGHRPGARDISSAMAVGGVPLFHRPTDGRTVLGQGSALGNRESTTWQEIGATLKASPDVPIVGGVGIPGYMGYIPNGNPANPHAGTRSPTRPGSAPSSTRAHATDYRAFDRSKLPQQMPIVGYTGHLRNTTGSTTCYGVSYWRPTVPPTRAERAAMAYESAKQKAVDALRPNDFMDNDPYAGMDGKRGTDAKNAAAIPGHQYVVPYHGVDLNDLSA